MISFEDIHEATDKYVATLQSKDMGQFIREMVIVNSGEGAHPFYEQSFAFEYPGLLNIHEDTPFKDILNHPVKLDGKKTTLSKVFAARPKFRYNFGILAVAFEEGAAHYVAIVLDNKQKEVYLWDSAVTNPAEEETETRNIVLALYPKYTLKSTNICKGCGMYQPGAGEGEEGSYDAQNIFCHTWSLWFIDRVTQGLGQDRTVESVIDQINTTCGTSRQNLVFIKKYIKNCFAHEYIDEKYKFDKAFDYIWDGKKSVRVIKDKVCMK